MHMCTLSPYLDYLACATLGQTSSADGPGEASASEGLARGRSPLQGLWAPFEALLYDRGRFQRWESGMGMDVGSIIPSVPTKVPPFPRFSFISSAPWGRHWGAPLRKQGCQPAAHLLTSPRLQGPPPSVKRDTRVTVSFGAINLNRFI